MEGKSPEENVSEMIADLKIDIEEGIHQFTQNSLISMISSLESRITRL